MAMPQAHHSPELSLDPAEGEGGPLRGGYLYHKFRSQRHLIPARSKKRELDMTLRPGSLWRRDQYRSPPVNARSKI